MPNLSVAAHSPPEDQDLSLVFMKQKSQGLSESCTGVGCRGEQESPGTKVGAREQK